MKNIILFISLLIASSSCRDETIAPETTDTGKKEDTIVTEKPDTVPVLVKPDTIDFTLYINYSSNENSCKTFVVGFDSTGICNKELCYAGISPCFLMFKFPVISGKKKIHAEIAGGTDVFSDSIDFIKTKPFGYLNYDSSSSGFSFHLSASGGID